MNGPMNPLHQFLITNVIEPNSANRLRYAQNSQASRVMSDAERRVLEGLAKFEEERKSRLTGEAEAPQLPPSVQDTAMMTARDAVLGGMADTGAAPAIPSKPKLPTITAPTPASEPEMDEQTIGDLYDHGIKMGLSGADLEGFIRNAGKVLANSKMQESAAANARADLITRMTGGQRSSQGASQSTSVGSSSSVTTKGLPLVAEAAGARLMTQRDPIAQTDVMREELRLRRAMMPQLITDMAQVGGAGFNEKRMAEIQAAIGAEEKATDLERKQNLDRDAALVRSYSTAAARENAAAINNSVRMMVARMNDATNRYKANLGAGLKRDEMWARMARFYANLERQVFADNLKRQTALASAYVLAQGSTPQAERELTQATANAQEAFVTGLRAQMGPMLAQLGADPNIVSNFFQATTEGMQDQSGNTYGVQGTSVVENPERGTVSKLVGFFSDKYSRYYGSGKSIAQIAAELNEPEETVKQELRVITVARGMPPEAYQKLIDKVRPNNPGKPNGNRGGGSGGGEAKGDPTSWDQVLKNLASMPLSERAAYRKKWEKLKPKQ